ncbi:MAG: hypothetical protein J6A37_08280 [Oscillospiraceae bacterium]|nr:hypothetical protein [Oscillospiraceae bacterium]
MAERIEDFGNKIGGAKKDLAAKNKTNLEIADVEKWTSLERKEYITKKNVWVQPDYRKLVDEDGVSVVCAYFIKKVRDALPAKPKYPRSVTAETSQEQYIQYISEIRDKVMTLKNESEIRDFFRWICDEYTTGRYVNEKSHGYLDNKLYKLAQSSADTLKRKLKKEHFLFSDDEIKLSNYNIIKADSIMNTAYDTRSCLVVKSGGSTYYYWNWKNDDNSLYKDINWKPDTYYVADKDNNIIANNFESKEAAEKFVVENSELNIEKRKTNRRKLFVPPLLKVIQRIGMNYREEEHADGQKMLDTFGFYGGEFGNWERQTERQMNLDYSYDAFMDLVYALDIDEKDISLGGKLSLAYGARGYGNALAHYEAFANVINLTRMKGAGSLAHEYGHAIDSFLAQQYDTGKAFITDTYIPIISNLMNTIKYTEVKGIKTDFFNEAQGMDKDYTGYWGSNRELFARAFACYLKDKLAEKGIRNDYLCGHCESAGTKGEERIRINAAFDAMFAELKEQGIFHSVNHDKVTEVVVREDIIVENNAESEKEAEEEIPITQADIDILRTLPPRKSVLNFTDEERALTANWAKRFENDIGEKSPYFRGEKGDWRENEDTKVPVINIVSTKKDFKNVRNDIKERIITRGEIINTDTNWNIQISRNGLEDTVKYGFKHKNPNVYDMLYSISDIVQNGIYLDSTLSENNNSTKANNTAFMHKLYGICKLDEEFCISKITVEEFKSGNQTTLKRLYNLQDIKIEPLRHIEFINDRLARSVLNGSEISISDLFAIVKSCDKDFYLNKRENPEINVTDIKKEPLRHVSFTAEQPHLKVLNGSEISISDSAENVNNESEQSNNSPVGNKQGKTMSKSQIGGKNNMSFRIIGDADYRNMQDKKYVNGSADEIGMLAEALQAQGISFSGNITNTRGTITVSGTEIYRKACDMLKAFQQSAPEPEKKNVIETKPYKYIADKKYVNGDEESIRKVIDILIKKKMEFSSNIRSKDRAAITVSGEENRKLVQSYLDYVRNEKAILAVKEYGFVITDTVNLTVKSPVGSTMSFDDYEQLNSAFEDMDNEFFHPTAYQVLETSDAFDEFYALYRIDTITGEEKGIVYNSDGEYVSFANVDEIMEYVGKEGIEIINSKEQLDSWAENDRNRLIERNHSVYVQMFEGDNHIELLPDNKVVWTYYNEDGKEGIGQLIEMTIREDVITEAWERYVESGSIDEFYGYLYSNAETVLFDSDSYDFEEAALSYIEDKNKSNTLILSEAELNTVETLNSLTDNFSSLKTVKLAEEMNLEAISADTAYDMIVQAGMDVYNAKHEKITEYDIADSEALYTSLDNVQKWGQIETIADLIDSINTEILNSDNNVNNIAAYGEEFQDDEDNVYRYNPAASEWENIARSLAQTDTVWLENFLNDNRYNEAVEMIIENAVDMLKEYKKAVAADKSEKDVFSEKYETEEDKILAMAERIQLNIQEDNEYIQNFIRYMNNELSNGETVAVGTTPNSLIISGAKKLPLNISQSTLKNTMNPEDVHMHGHSSGHNISADILMNLPKDIRTPLMIIEDEKKNLIAVLDKTDSESRNIICRITLDKEEKQYTVNRISSIYGKNELAAYIDRAIAENRVKAVQKEKAEMLLNSIGCQSSKELNAISFDNTITYTTEYVKYPEKSTATEIGDNSPVGNFENVFEESEINTFDDVSEKNAESNLNATLNLPQFNAAIDLKKIDSLKIENGDPAVNILMYYSNNNNAIMRGLEVDENSDYEISTSDAEQLISEAEKNGCRISYSQHNGETVILQDYREKKTENEKSDADKNYINVEVDFTENDILYNFIQAHGKSLSVAMASALLEYLDEKQHSEAHNDLLPDVLGYDKTGIGISGKMNGKDFYLSDRYDIGDGPKFNGSLSHWLAYADANKELIELVKQNEELTDEERAVMEEIRKENPILNPQAEETEISSFTEQGVESPNDIGIGDKFTKNGDIYTVVSETGVYPDDVTIQKISRSGNTEYAVNTNVSRRELFSEYSYLQDEVNIVDKKQNTENKLDYTITDDDFNNGGGLKTRFRQNVEAIKTLRIIEAENRTATSAEMDILAKYVGWGGIAQAFDSTKPDWSAEYAELKELLTDSEYINARASVNNAHYTSPVVINAIYSALDNMGFKGGKILEPAMGTGNFFGAMPEEMRKNSTLTGIEIDDITGRIAKQLYQTADVNVCGYERTKFADNSFDVAIGNVPFGDYKVFDKEYNKLNFNIHDYFFAKTLDKVRPGGVVAFVTSQGTLDKKNSDVRKYLAKRAEMLGAIRLPNNAFKGIAGTEVTTDIIFLQKRERAIDIEPDWVTKDYLDNGIAVNQYFAEHPEMILGEMVEGNKMFGNGTMCIPVEGANLKEQLAEAVKNIQGEFKELSNEQKNEQKANVYAPVESKKFSFVVQDDKLYYRNGSQYMTLADVKEKDVPQIKALCEIREKLNEVLEAQIDSYDRTNTSEITTKMNELNEMYDAYVAKYGRICKKETAKLFEEDYSYQLVKALEINDSEGNFKRKADVMEKILIKAKQPVQHVENANDALLVSLSEKFKVDIEFMTNITGMDETTLISELEGRIYQNPAKDMHWETADEYLSGNVREKLEVARAANLRNNVEALERVLPEKVEAVDIKVKLGTSWISPEYVKRFILETLNIRRYSNLYHNLDVEYSERTNDWKVTGYKNSELYGNILATEVYGTEYMNALKIIDATLNLKTIEIKKDKLDEYGDPVLDVNGNTVRVVDQKATELVQAKQEALQNKFKEWLFDDPDRRIELVDKYNRLFNNTVLREYDGSNLNFVGMNEDIKLNQHQVNAVARGLSGGNTLLAHEVGAGKTFEMIAIAMEGKRLGLHNKSMMAVPNHLTEQTGQAFRELYPACNILVATEKDFKPENRKAMMAKIATGDWDAVIVGHSQFDMCALSVEKEKQYINEELAEMQAVLEEERIINPKSISVKGIERSIKQLESKLQSLNDKQKKDDFIEFEKLGIDKLFIDESQEYKNLSTATKMNNVSGVASNGSAKALQLLMKCKYMDEVTDGNGIVFASGTPISNSMVEMYTISRYLQSAKLSEMGIDSFDKWASVFGETETAMEVKPTGDGQYQNKTRFAHFINLPELQTVFRDVADVKLVSGLNIERPDAKIHNVNVPASRYQRRYVKKLGKRSEACRAGLVDKHIDNMLKITTDGRKVGLDARCIDPNIPDDPASKVNVCINNVFDIWKKTEEKRSTQLIFCDLATPQKPKNEDRYFVFRKQEDGTYAKIYSGGIRTKDKSPERILESLKKKLPKDFVEDEMCGVLAEGDIIVSKTVDIKGGMIEHSGIEIGKGGIGKPVTGVVLNDIGTPPQEVYEHEKSFCVYDDIKDKLVKMGVPAEEIAFIHDCKNNEEKQKLFDKMNKGEVRIMIGSTQKCGAGMNAQAKMIALHDLDAPYRPSDMGQRHGRIERRGNENKEVDIYRYMTEKTFDSYLYQLLENKQTFISQIMTEKTALRVCEDIDDSVLDFGTAKALCSGKPIHPRYETLQTSILRCIQKKQISKFKWKSVFCVGNK